MGSLYQRLDKKDTAILNYKLSLKYADSVQILDFMAYVNNELASIYESMGNFEKSLHYYKAADQIEDSIANNESRKKFVLI